MVLKNNSLSMSDLGCRISGVRCPKSHIRNPTYTEGAFDVGFVMSDVGGALSEIRHHKSDIGGVAPACVAT